MGNIAYIFQPHFMSNCFRVALKDQMGTEKNFVVVTCSPEYNGVYEYPSSNIINKDYDIWVNNKVECVCVPIKDCKFVGKLDKVSNSKVRLQIKKQQLQWYRSEVKNNPKKYKSKPNWMLGGNNADTSD